MSSFTYSKESLAHIGLHELIVEIHDLDEVLQRRHFNIIVLGLRGLADNLHYIVAFSLDYKIEIDLLIY